VSLKLAAVVLAGGEGRRMGGGKPLKPWRGGTLVSHALEKARGYAPRVALAVRTPDQAGGLDAPLLTDPPGIAGPLAGLCSALAFAAEEGVDAVLTLPCDVPFAPADLAVRLAEALTDDVGVTMAESRGRWHPTCALWRAGLDGALADYAAAGGRSLRGFAERAGLRLVDWGAAEQDPFANVNTPEDLARLGPH